MSFMYSPDTILAPHRRLEDEIIIDDFCGGGGASEAIYQALGRHPDEAANHDADALVMHTINHPTTNHWNQNIWQLDPYEVSRGRPIGMAWFSPDCKHFSPAAAGKPRDRNIRNLAWVVHLYARMPTHIRPRIIIVENVPAFETWGDLLPNGQPDPAKKGETFRQWVAELRRQGYVVEWRKIKARDYGAPTIRERLFIIARCDGLPIVWPTPTHGDPLSVDVRAGRLAPWKTVAEQIDWSLPCPSIFLRSKALAETTLRRLAKGFIRYVLQAATPFIVTCNHAGDGFRGQGVHEPFKTITAARDAHGLVVPFISRYHNKGTIGAPIDTPCPTLETRNKTAVVAAYLTSFYSHCTNGGNGRLDRPLGTITAEGFHHGLVQADLAMASMSDEERYSAWWVARFVEVYGDAGPSSVLPGPRPSYLAVAGVPVTDIGMRMLQPREMFNAQGFRPDYVIDFDIKGKPVSKEIQQRLCGNSVSPPPAIAIIRANCLDLAVETRRAA